MAKLFVYCQTNLVSLSIEIYFLFNMEHPQERRFNDLNNMMTTWNKFIVLQTKLEANLIFLSLC